MTNLKEYEKEVEEIRFTIERVIRKYMCSAKVTSENFNKAIRVQQFNIGLNFWIRLTPKENNKIIIDFSTIELPEQYRRKGIFTEVFETLKNIRSVYSIHVTSVITDEMRNWCVKNGLKQVEYNYNDYYIGNRH